MLKLVFNPHTKEELIAVRKASAKYGVPTYGQRLVKHLKDIERRRKKTARVYSQINGACDFINVLEKALKTNQKAIALGHLVAAQCDVDLTTCTLRVKVTDSLAGNDFAYELCNYYKDPTINKIVNKRLTIILKTAEHRRALWLENGKAEPVNLWSMLYDAILHSRKAASGYCIDADECKYFAKSMKLLVAIEDVRTQRFYYYISSNGVFRGQSHVRESMPRILLGLLKRIEPQQSC